MTPYFGADHRVRALRVEAEGWLGTPFRDGSGGKARKKICCDCVSWVAAALQTAGAIGGFKWPRYVSMTGGPEMLHLLNKALRQVPRLALVWERPQQMVALLPGDVMVGTRGRSGHHIALYLGGNELQHCWDGCVRLGNTGDSVLRRRLISVWRPYVE